MTLIITYEQMKGFYEDFKKNPPLDGFERYYREVSFMKSLKEFAKKQGLENEVLFYQKIEEDSKQKLRDLGYKI